MKKILFYSLPAIAMALSLTACNSEYSEISNGSNVAVSERLSAYEKSFKEIYGDVPANKNWDFTQVNYASNAFFGAETRDAGNEIPFDEIGSREGMYEIPADLLTWLNANLPEYKDNRKKGGQFVLTMPANGFYVIPIYQGYAEMNWDLCIELSEEPYSGAPYCDLWKKGDMEMTMDGVNWSKVGENRHTMAAKSVRGPIIKITPSKSQTLEEFVGNTFNPYLYITKGQEGVLPEGSKQYAIAQPQQMLTMKVPSEFIPQEDLVKITGAKNSQAMVIGCEDLTTGDWDMNDVVFLVIGAPDLPPVSEVIQKRYMIEDLGATNVSDIDFNDIVIDLNQVINGNSKTQTATIRAVGGTMDFDLEFEVPAGSDNWVPVFRKGGDAYDVTYNESFYCPIQVTKPLNPKQQYNVGINVGETVGTADKIDYRNWVCEINLKDNLWEPDNNNIRIHVLDEFDGKYDPTKVHDKLNVNGYYIYFPEVGSKAPAMIAFNPWERNWRPERVSITKKDLWYAE